MKLKDVDLGMKIVDSRFPGEVGIVVRIWESGGTHRKTTIDSVEITYPKSGTWEYDSEDEGTYEEQK